LLVVSYPAKRNKTIFPFISLNKKAAYQRKHNINDVINTYLR
jgi:hypothetical protein